MCIQLIVREAHKRRLREQTRAFMAGASGLTPQREAEYGYRHGWISFDGQSYDMESAFPEQRFPRFPADQGLSD